MKRTIYLIGVLLFLACVGESPAARLRSYVENPANKITQTRSFGDLSIKTRYLPKEYQVLSNPSFRDDDDYIYFKVNINKLSSTKLPKQHAEHLIFEIEKDFVLNQGGEEISAPVICQKIETGIAGDFEYMVVFAKDKTRGITDFALEYHDKIFGIGDVIFPYSRKQLEKIPGIKAEKTL